LGQFSVCHRKIYSLLMCHWPHMSYTHTQKYTYMPLSGTQGMSIKSDGIPGIFPIRFITQKISHFLVNRTFCMSFSNIPGAILLNHHLLLPPIAAVGREEGARPGGARGLLPTGRGERVRDIAAGRRRCGRAHGVGRVGKERGERELRPRGGLV
jgi:hypothetical protein